MNYYTGTKLLMAQPMSRAEYNDYRGWDLPEDEDGTDAGYLVEYTDGGQSNHPGHQGYISWSPTAVFEGAYTAIGAASDLQGIPPHLLRVRAEVAALRANIVKLGNFFQTPAYKHLPLPARELLKVQLPAMLAYAAVLDTRIQLG